MQHSDEQCIILTEYPLPEDTLLCLEKAGTLLGVSQQDIVIRALHEFFEKHGICAEAHETVC